MATHSIGKKMRLTVAQRERISNAAVKNLAAPRRSKSGVSINYQFAPSAIRESASSLLPKENDFLCQ